MNFIRGLSFVNERALIVVFIEYDFSCSHSHAVPINEVGGTLLGELQGICHIANSCGANGCFHGADILYIDLSAHREATRVSQYSTGNLIT